MNTPVSARPFHPLYYFVVLALMSAVAGMVSAGETGRIASPLVRENTAALARSDEEFRLYGSDFQFQQFVNDSRLQQTVEGGAFQTHFLYSPQTNAFKLPVSLPLAAGFSAFVTIPFLQRESKSDAYNLRTQGLGDLSTGLGWSVAAGRFAYLQTRGFVKLPTGDTEAEAYQTQLPLGTGSTDYGGTVHGQVRPFERLFLLAGYGYRVNGRGWTAGTSEDLVDTRRGIEESRTVGFSLLPLSFVSVGAKWADIRQGATRLYGDGPAPVIIDDGRIRDFWIPEIAAYFGGGTQLTLQAHLPADTGANRLLAWQFDDNALVDLSVAAYF